MGHISTRPVRSQSYQYKILECSYDFHTWCNFFNTEEGLYGAAISEQIKELDQLTFELLVQIGIKTFTPKQLSVFNCLSQGMGQVAIAKLLNNSKNNSTINKTVKGSKGYGGINRKLMKECLQTEQYRQYIFQLWELEGGYMLNQTMAWFDHRGQFMTWLQNPLHPKYCIPIWVAEDIEICVRKFNRPAKNHVYSTHPIIRFLSPKTAQWINQHRALDCVVQIWADIFPRK